MPTLLFRMNRKQCLSPNGKLTRVKLKRGNGVYGELASVSYLAVKRDVNVYHTSSTYESGSVFNESDEPLAGCLACFCDTGPLYDINKVRRHQADLQ